MYTERGKCDVMVWRFITEQGHCASCDCCVNEKEDYSLTVKALCHRVVYEPLVQAVSEVDP